MGLSESIEKILQNTNGQLSLDKITDILGKKYGRQTILDFLQNEKNLITFDGETITLLKYPLQHFISILEKFIRNTGANQKDVFYSGAFYLFLRRQFPKLVPEEVLDFIKNRKYSEIEDHNLFEIEQIAMLLGDSFVRAMNHFFDSGWIEKLDSKEFYSFSREFYEYYINSSSGGRELFTTPTTLVQLICQIIPTNRSLRVYNPAAGMLKLMTAIKVSSRFEIMAVASEINKEVYKIGQLFARTNGFELNFQNMDSMDEIEHLGTSSFDLIVSIPPFMTKVNIYERYNIAYKDLALNIISSSLKKLQENGMAIFLVPDGVLFGNSRDYHRFRREIIESRLIHTIVSLPVNLFYPTTSVKSSLLIFRKGVNHQTVRFIDASSKQFYSITRDKSVSLEIDKIVDLIESSSNPNSIQEDQAQYGIPESLEFDFQQLKNEGFSLNLNDYFIKYIQPQESGYTELGKLIIQLKLPLNNGTDLPYLRITDLNGGSIDEINRLSKNKSRTKGKILSEQAFLIGTVGGSSKPSWYRLSTPVELSTNIVALKIIPGKAHYEYLLQELNSTYVQKQMEFLSLGSTTLKHLRLEDLLKVKIKLPSLNDQIRISKERSEYVQEQSFSAKKETETITDVAIFKTINHEIGNILKGPDGFLNLLPQFLERNQIQLDVPSSGHNQARPIGERIQSAKDDIAKVYQIMANMEGILLAESSFFRPEKTDLANFMRKKFDQLKDHQTFDFIIGTNGSYLNPGHIQAEIDKMQFEHIFNNILSNAVNHSNTSINESLKILINLVLIENKIEIHFMNNGEPFPADFTLEDFIGFSRKSGKSSGQGIGGFLINKVAKNHSGQISFMPPTSFQVKTKDGGFDYKANVDIVITIPQKQ